MRKSIFRKVLLVVLTALLTWILLETTLRVYLGWPLTTDFYGSIARHVVLEQQAKHQVQVATGIGWAHLGWIAHPEAETYRIDIEADGRWQEIGRSKFGSHLVRTTGRYRVWAQAHDGAADRLVGEAVATPRAGTAPLHAPQIDGPWQELFRPTRSGNYVNDHTVYRDALGQWRVLGITAAGTGDYTREIRFAHGVSDEFPPAQGMREAEAVADFGELAWAPHAVVDEGTYYLFWSPHRLRRMRSADGVTWDDHRIVMKAPFHKFFRDAMILQPADGQVLRPRRLAVHRSRAAQRLRQRAQLRFRVHRVPVRA
jgi:hypothetical protein